MKYTHVYALFLVFVFCTSCKGQNQTNIPKDNSSKEPQTEPQLKQNSAGEEAARLAATSKVPVSMVRNVKQARNGDILIASFLGVFRYDGTSFTNLTSKISSPRFSSFWDVLEDRKGNLWLGTRDSCVYFYDGKSFQHFTTNDGLASNMALNIYEDKAGIIWIGASRYDGKSFRNFTTKDGFPSNKIRLLLEDKTGKLWFGAQGEDMFVYDGKTFTVLKNKDGKAFNNVWSIIEDKKGNIWFGADGLWRYDGMSFTKVSQRGAYAIIEDKKGNIWTTGVVVNGDWALSRYDANSLYNKEPNVTEIMSQRTMLLGLLEARDGSIWFGSGGGVYRYDGKTITDFKSAAGQK
ncbi:MAG: two-component regulator propeller domain-containing protein [Ferruginibacter sp.]